MKELCILGHWEIFNKDFTIYGTVANPLFLAKEVAKLIEHSQVVRMIENVDSDEKAMNSIHTLGGIQKCWFLTENGLYEVLMQSRKPIAKQFKAKVKEILKTIRKTGTYTISPHERDIQNQIEKARKFISALDITLEIFRRTNQGDSRQELSPALTLLSAYASAEVLNVLRATDQMGITKI